jgi:hypothetical protein
MTALHMLRSTISDDPRSHHYPRNRSVRFVFGIAAASHNTRFQAARYGLTWADLHRLIAQLWLAPSNYSITSSARSRIDGGIANFSGLAPEALHATCKAKLRRIIKNRDMLQMDPPSAFNSDLIAEHGQKKLGHYRR